MTDLYHDDLLAELDSLHNVGELPQADKTWRESNASCGDDVTFQVSFDKTDGADRKIKAIAWKGHGCAVSQVSCSLLSEFVKGKTVTEIAKLTQSDLESLLGINSISIGRVKCLLLPLTALRSLLAQEK